MKHAFIFPPKIFIHNKGVLSVIHMSKIFSCSGSDLMSLFHHHCFRSQHHFGSVPEVPKRQSSCYPVVHVLRTSLVLLTSRNNNESCLASWCGQKVSVPSKSIHEFHHNQQFTPTLHVLSKPNLIILKSCRNRYTTKTVWSIPIPEGSPSS